MPKIAYKDFRAKLARILWPSGEPRNLRVPHDSFFVSAMQDLQKWVVCNRENNIDVFDACASYVSCAQTIIEAPLNGTISRVYTIANGIWCDQVHYQKVSYKELQCLARNTITGFTAPTNKGMPALQQGWKHHEKSTDSSCGRAIIGVYAFHRDRIYIFPWIQSNEQVIVEWDGWKTDWKDNDQLEQTIWDKRSEDAVRFFVRKEHEDEYGSPDQASKAKKNFEDARADVMYWCDQKRAIPDDDCCTPRARTQAEVENEAVPDEVTSYTFAVIGDFGFDNANEALVSALVDTFGASDVFTTGDNDYVGDLDLSVGKYYQKYLFPYSGAHGAGSVDGQNHFWPVPGNHDWDIDGPGATTLQKYIDFFTLPPNERYYELKKGPIHFIMVSSDPREPDGNTPTSKQAEWVKAKLLLSTARWKVVIIQDPPYTSSNNGDSPGHTRSRWPYKDWGADIVLSGDAHSYERLEVDGLPYIVNGAGGATLDGFIAPIAGSLARHSEFGAMKVVADCDQMKFEFFNTSSVLLDSLTLTKT